MTMSASVRMMVEIAGLDSDDINFPIKFDVSDPTTFTMQRRIQAVADTEESLDLGGVSTIELVIIKAITNDMLIDCDFTSTFDADLSVEEGTAQVFKPEGTVKIINKDAGVQCTYLYIVIGTT